MQNYYCEVFVDERPIHKQPYSATNEAAAIGRAMRDARKTGIIKRNRTTFVVRARRMRGLSPVQDGDSSL